MAHIRTGQPLRNGGFLAVLDLDPRHGGGASLSRWVAENGSLPDTYTVATGGGGEHRYFHTPEPLGCRTGVLPGVDLKADGGYVVGPGSVHPGDPKRNVPPGGRYEVRRNVPVAPMPAALLALVAKPAARTAGAAEPAPAAPIADGHRNATLTSLAGSMRRRGMRAVAIRAALLAENAARCTPPLSEVEVTSIAKSVATYPPEAVEPPRPLVREIPPADPYPVEALGSVLSGAARAIHDRIQAPDAVCGQSVLASATLAAQAHADVVLPTGARRPLSLFLLSVLETGGRKTACDNVAGEPLRRWEAAEPEKHGPEYLRRRNEDDVWEQERRKVLADTKENPAGKREKLKTLGPEPIAPPLPMLTCPDRPLRGCARCWRFLTHPLACTRGKAGSLLAGTA